MISERPVPAYSLFGQTAGLVEPQFCHVERIGDRWPLHSGRVEQHSHPHLHQMTLWIAGQGQYFADEEVMPVRAGSLCWIPAGVIHGFRVEAGSEAIVLSMSGDFAREQFSGLAQLQPFHKAMLFRFDKRELDWLTGLFRRMEAEYSAMRTGGIECIGSLARLTMCELIRKDAPAEVARQGTAGDAPLLLRFMALMEARLGQRPNVDELATELGTTPYLLNRACRAGLGMRASEVVRARHMQEAKRLLLFTALGVGEIGNLTGYADPAHFARSFREAVGQSPRDWRESRIAAQRSTADTAKAADLNP